METTMGKVVVPARIENIYDLYEVNVGTRRAEDARFVEVDSALVDAGASTLSLPRRFVAALGLQPLRTGRARTSAGPVVFQIYGPVRLHVQGRECNCDLVEIPDDCPVLIGQIPLESLDFVIDPMGRRLIGNPEHGGKQMIELF